MKKVKIFPLFAHGGQRSLLNQTLPRAVCKIGSSSSASKHEVVAWPGDDTVDRAHDGDGAVESVLAVV
jgi:hypothetical protein